MRRRCFEPKKAVRDVLKEGHSLAASLNETSPRVVKGLIGTAAVARQELLDGLDSQTSFMLQQQERQDALMSQQEEVLKRLLQGAALGIAPSSELERSPVAQVGRKGKGKEQVRRPSLPCLSRALLNYVAWHRQRTVAASSCVLTPLRAGGVALSPRRAQRVA